MEPEWKDVRNYLAPEAGSFDDPVSEKTKRKDPYYRQNINTLPMQYMANLATALAANLTPSKLRWFRLGVKDSTREEEIWLKQASETMYSVFNSAGLYENLYNSYFESMCFGPSVLGMQPNNDMGLDFIPNTIGEFWYAENAAGVVNTLYRRFAMSNFQIYEQFGDKTPCDIKLALEQDDTESLHTVIHAVEPNPSYLPKFKNSFNKPYISVYYLEGHNSDFLEKKGLSKFPFMIARWNKYGKNIYGSGVGKTILGDVKSLQAYEADLAKASKKKISPPLKGSTQLKNAVKDTSANAITYTDDPNGFTALYNVNYETGEALQNIQRISQRIYELTYNNLFYALLNKEKTMSATEAGGIQQEQLMMLGSIVERLQFEFLEPLIEGAFNILYENGWFSPPPASLEGKDLDIQYQSLLAMNQDLGDLSLLERWLQFVTSVAAINPVAARKPNVLTMVNYYGKKLGVDFSLINSDSDVNEEVKLEQEAELQQRQQQQQLEALDVMSQSAKNMNGVETGANRAMRDISGG